VIQLKNRLNQIKNKLYSFKSDKPKSLNKKTAALQKTTCSENNCILISRWGILAIVIIFLVFIGAILTSFNEINPAKDSPALVANKEVIGNDSRGIVTKEGPYGNISSPIKIAFILGIHPRESRAHNSTIANIRENSKSLKKCYYLYYINVTNYTYDYSMGRMNGQKLAYKYIVPDVNKNNYSLAIDVHASNGRYTDKPFVFVPVDDKKSLEVTKNLTNTLKWLYYYSMPDPSSPAYSTIPIIKNGTSAIIYEAYANPSNTIKQQVKEFIMALDNLDLN
jgi:hypothetical protein